MNIKKLLFAAAITMTVAACENDSYNTGDGDYSDVMGEFIEAHSDKDCSFDYALNDKDETITFDSRYFVKWMTRPDTLYRALLVYHKTGYPKVKPINIAQIPTLLPRKLVAEERMKCDPVEKESVWVSDNHKYINMSFFLYIGGNMGDAQRHIIGIVEESVDTLSDGKTIANLHFYHDQNHVNEYYVEQYYASVPCDSLTTDSVNLKLMTNNGLVETRLRVKY